MDKDGYLQPSAAHSLTQAAPPARSVGDANISFHHVPIYFTPFIGREHEVQEVYSLLLRPEVRLLTLSGPSGIGKTRLALQLAERV